MNASVVIVDVCISCQCYDCGDARGPVIMRTESSSNCDRNGISSSMFLLSCF